MPKFVTSDAPGFGVPFSWVWSSGVALKMQPGGISFGLLSFETPCSMRYASPEKISRDLFCAFHPKRAMVWSLPLRLNSPSIPSCARRVAVSAVRAKRVVGRVLHEADAEERRGDAEDDVEGSELRGEVRLRQDAPRCVDPALDRVDLVDAAVVRSHELGRDGDEPWFPHRTIGRDEARDHVLAPSSVASATCRLGTGFCGLLKPGCSRRWPAARGTSRSCWR